MQVLPVNFYASLRKIAGTKTVELRLPDHATINYMVETVVNLYPEMERKLLEESGQLSRRAHIFINGRNCLLLDNGLETSPTVDDSIDVFPIGHF